MARPTAAEIEKARPSMFFLPEKKMFPKFQKGGKPLTLSTLEAIPRLAGRSRNAGNISAAQETRVVNASRRELQRRTGKKRPSLARAA